MCPEGFWTGRRIEYYKSFSFQIFVYCYSLPKIKHKGTYWSMSLFTWGFSKIPSEVIKQSDGAEEERSGRRVLGLGVLAVVKWAHSRPGVGQQHGQS